MGRKDSDLLKTGISNYPHGPGDRTRDLLEVLVNQIYVGIFIAPDVSTVDVPRFEALQRSSYNATPIVRSASRSDGKLLQPHPPLGMSLFPTSESDDEEIIVPSSIQWNVENLWTSHDFGTRSRSSSLEARHPADEPDGPLLTPAVVLKLSILWRMMGPTADQ